MILTAMVMLAIQAGSLVESEAEPPPAAAETSRRDIYTECFLRELSALEGRDVGNSRDGFSRANAMNAIRRCRTARDRLATQIESQLSADPAYSDAGLRAVELENRVALVELPLLLLIRAMGR
jgi:hypothetical protein